MVGRTRGPSRVADSVHRLAVLAFTQAALLVSPVLAQPPSAIEAGVSRLESVDLPYSSVVKGFARQASFLLINEELDWYRDLVSRVGLDPDSETVQTFLLTFHGLEQEPWPENLEPSMAARHRHKIEWLGRELGLFLRTLKNEGWSRNELDSLLESIDRVQRRKMSIRLEYVGEASAWGPADLAREERSFDRELHRWVEVTLPSSSQGRMPQ